MNKVSVITPATPDRILFIERLTESLSYQTYDNFEWLIDYEPGTIGEKRNRLCAAATGDIILHMDSDDLYADDWISQSVEALVTSGANIVGLSSGYFYQPHEILYEWRHPDGTQLHLLGATLCYWRNVWERKPFPAIQEGEDTDFITNNGKLFAHGYKDGFVATLHGSNTCSHKALGHEQMVKLPDSNVEVMKQRWFTPRLSWQE